MFSQLFSTPVAKRAGDIFATVRPGTVTLLQGYTGSGKSLVSPMACVVLFGGDVLSLVPSRDVAKDNARRIAELSDDDWQLGQEVGLYAGGVNLRGTQVTVATYGSFLANPRLNGRSWKAILLDESHVEQWQVEVARADVLARLMEGHQTAVMEMTATMDRLTLERYWGQQGIEVACHEIPGLEPPFMRELVHRPYVGVPALVEERLAAGDRLIMVTQPGLRDVEAMALKLKLKVGESVSVLSFHGETEPEEAGQVVSRLGENDTRVIVSTPRLLTGFNHEDLDTVITDGRAKYPHSSTNGGSELRGGDMSQAELIQALGRVGRFKDGRLILAAEDGYEGRRATMLPEVERLSSLPLCLTLAALGRDARQIQFCHQPKDIPASFKQLMEWGFLDSDGRITPAGVWAEKLDIRLDLAHFLRGVLESDVPVQTKAAAVMMAAVVEGDGVTSSHRDGVRASVFNTKADPINMMDQFANALAMDKAKLKEKGYSKRSLARAKAIAYRILDMVTDRKVQDYFGAIWDEGKNLPDGQLSKRNRAWQKVGQQLFHLSENVLNKLRLAWVQTYANHLYLVQKGRRGFIGVSLITGDSYALGNESCVKPLEGDFLTASRQVIHPRNGRSSFTVLTEIMMVKLDELVAWLPERVEVDTRRAMYDYYRFETVNVVRVDGRVVAKKREVSPLTSEEEAKKAAFEANRAVLRQQLDALNPLREELGMERIRHEDEAFRFGYNGSAYAYTADDVARAEADNVKAIEARRAELEAARLKAERIAAIRPQFVALSQLRMEAGLSELYMEGESFYHEWYWHEFSPESLEMLRAELEAHVAEQLVDAERVAREAAEAQAKAEAEEAARREEESKRQQAMAAGKARIEKLNRRREALGWEALDLFAEGFRFEERYVPFTDDEGLQQAEREVVAEERKRADEAAPREKAITENSLMALAAAWGANTSKRSGTRR